MSQWSVTISSHSWETVSSLSWISDLSPPPGDTSPTFSFHHDCLSYCYRVVRGWLAPLVLVMWPKGELILCWLWRQEPLVWWAGPRRRVPGRQHYVQPSENRSQGSSFWRWYNMFVRNLSALNESVKLVGYKNVSTKPHNIIIMSAQNTQKLIDQSNSIVEPIYKVQGWRIGYRYKRTPFVWYLKGKLSGHWPHSLLTNNCITSTIRYTERLESIYVISIRSF